MVFVLTMNPFIGPYQQQCWQVQEFSFPIPQLMGLAFSRVVETSPGPGLGFPPPSRSGWTLKPRRTITVGSSKDCNLETGVVDGRSRTSGNGTPLSVAGYEL